VSEYHVPVLFRESIDGLKINESGIYVDVTFGGGGHSRGILDELGESGSLIAFDQDPDAAQNVPHDGRFELVPQNFRFMKNHLRFMRKLPVDGVLADLGVSSHQFDEANRGFTIRQDGPLDMRMNPKAGVSAAEFVATADEAKLADVLYFYGEFKQARAMAAELVRKRADQTIKTTFDLLNAMKRFEPKFKPGKYQARLFQALRIEVNDEMAVLKDWLSQLPEVLAVGGRVVVISYHSLEDRLVKNFFRTGNFEGKQDKDFHGNLIRPLEPITRKVVVPSSEEIEMNSRARSARLRIAERIDG
jgi:16S rRNA (cytosine1402-N4)-methyltransferase